MFGDSFRMVTVDWWWWHGRLGRLGVRYVSTTERKGAAAAVRHLQSWAKVFVSCVSQQEEAVEEEEQHDDKGHRLGVAQCAVIKVEVVDVALLLVFTRHFSAPKLYLTQAVLSNNRCDGVVCDWLEVCV